MVAKTGLSMQIRASFCMAYLPASTAGVEGAAP